MKTGKLDHEKGRSLVWVLVQQRAMLEAEALERVERRLVNWAATRISGVIVVIIAGRPGAVAAD